MLHTSNLSSLFWNLENPVLVQALSYRRKIAYNSLLIGFSHKVISMQDVGHMLLQLNRSTAAMILSSSCTNELSPTHEKDAVLNKQFPFGNDLIKCVKNKKAEKHGI